MLSYEALEFAKMFKAIMKKKIVTSHDYQNLSDTFCNASVMKFEISDVYFYNRCINLAWSKHLRTSIIWGAYTRSQNRLLAFQSHNLISSLCAANKSSSGRSESHRFGRYTLKIGDLFKGLACLKNASPANVPFSQKRGAPLGGSI